MRKENWQADIKRNLELLGVTSKKLPFFKTINPGDKIITYVSSRVSSFSGIREVTSENPEKSTANLGYDDNYDYCIKTRKLMVLTNQNYVPIKPLLNKLELTSGKKHWMNLLMTSIREISAADYETIKKEIEYHATKELL